MGASDARAEAREPHSSLGAAAPFTAHAGPTARLRQGRIQAEAAAQLESIEPPVRPPAGPWDRAVLGRLWRGPLSSLARLLYPELCWLCRTPAAGGVCPACSFEDPAPRSPRCGLCALRLPEVLAGLSETERVCARCRREPPPFAGAVCLGDYTQAGVPRDLAGSDPAHDPGHAPESASPTALREWILALKHGGRPELARRLGWSLALEARRLPLPAGLLVTSVPLHPTRRFERGYDQGRLLGQSVSEALGLGFVEALERCRPTLPQGSPGAAGRAENVRGAFRGIPGPKAAAWLLVDDVGTSLATAREAALALGAGRGLPVFLALVARAEYRHRALGLAADGDPDG
jgi:predicted amidophosphoribosyltransferase